MKTLLALAAGASGSLITLGAQGVFRYYAARHEIGSHDRIVCDLEGDLERWIVDDDVQLRRGTSRRSRFAQRTKPSMAVSTATTRVDQGASAACVS
jgi:hypothetical protein